LPIHHFTPTNVPLGDRAGTTLIRADADTTIRIMSVMKPLFFVGSAREDLAAFPEGARREAGYELFMVQAGRQPADFKPLPDVGTGVYEIRVRDQMMAFRVIYVAKLEDAVYVLHAFQKKTRKTSRLDIELAKRRYGLIGAKS
jgi:phage-related protein